METARKEDREEIVNKSQVKHGMRREGSEEHLEGRRKNQLTCGWGRNK